MNMAIFCQDGDSLADLIRPAAPGEAIRKPTTPPAPKTPKPVKQRKPARRPAGRKAKKAQSKPYKRAGKFKGDRIIAKLRTGWVSKKALCKFTGWPDAAVRGFLSRLRKPIDKGGKFGLNIIAEYRENDTYYKIHAE